MANPTFRSNWVRLWTDDQNSEETDICMGEYPSQEDVEKLEKAGISVFVDLTQEIERVRRRITSYTTSGTYISGPIKDHSVLPEKELRDFIKDIIPKISGKKVYIHCFAGLGRSGSVVGTLLHHLYHCDYETVYRSLNNSLKTRKVKVPGAISPQTIEQAGQLMIMCKPEIPSL